MRPNMAERPRAITSRRTTITDMSEALGLTKSTVSRALNGYPDISESTRLRVMRMAEKMRYRPLSQAQAIRTGRARAIGFIIEAAEHDAHRPFLADFLAGVSSAASKEGWTLTVAASTTPEETLEVIEKLCDDRKADGFIVPRTLAHDTRIGALRKLGVPFVLFGRTVDLTDCAFYDIDGEDAMRRAVLRLADLGHRRIAFINGGSRYNYSILREAGYRKGMEEAGLTIWPGLLAVESLNASAGSRAASGMLDLKEPPTAFVCALDQTALGVYAAAAKRGLRIGRDLSVIAYDGIPEGTTVDPPLSTFSVDSRRAGERLGALLLRRVRGEAPEELRELEQAQFLDRGSAGPPPQYDTQRNQLTDTQGRTPE